MAIHEANALNANPKKIIFGQVFLAQNLFNAKKKSVRSRIELQFIVDHMFLTFVCLFGIGEKQDPVAPILGNWQITGSVEGTDNSEIANFTLGISKTPENPHISTEIHGADEDGVVVPLAKVEIDCEGVIANVKVESNSATLEFAIDCSKKSNVGTTENYQYSYINYGTTILLTLYDTTTRKITSYRLQKPQPQQSALTSMMPMLMMFAMQFFMRRPQAQQGNGEANQ